jgi:hypothetical protein
MTVALVVVRSYVRTFSPGSTYVGTYDIFCETKQKGGSGEKGEGAVQREGAIQVHVISDLRFEIADGVLISVARPPTRIRTSGTGTSTVIAYRYAQC